MSVCVPTAVIAVLGFTVTAKASESGAVAAVSVGAEPTAPFSPGAVVAPRLVISPRGTGGLTIYATPGDATPTEVLPASDELGSPLVLLSVGSEGDWYQVLLPTRPNGSTGWVRFADVRAVAPVNRVEISLTTHELRVVRVGDGAGDDAVRAKLR